MRTFLLACGFAAGILAGGYAPAQTEQGLYETLVKGPGGAEALETVLKQPDKYSALILYGGAFRAFKEERLEDSGFLFYAGRLRARYDQVCFPPIGKGGNDPFLAYAAVSRTIGSAVNPAVMDQPLVFEKVLNRLKMWHPTAPEEYDPGYEHTQRLTEEKANKAAEQNRVDYLTSLSDLCTLLKDDEYLAASRVVRAYNEAIDDKGPTEEEYEKALATVKGIEKKKGLKGFGSY